MRKQLSNKYKKKLLHKFLSNSNGVNNDLIFDTW